MTLDAGQPSALKCSGLHGSHELEPPNGCNSEAVVAIRLIFDGTLYPWAPACIMHGFSVIHNLHLAEELGDQRYDMDWAELSDMPDLKEGPILPPEFREAMQRGTPPDIRIEPEIVDQVSHELAAEELKRIQGPYN
jgi:hypothetical protein